MEKSVELDPHDASSGPLRRRWRVGVGEAVRLVCGAPVGVLGCACEGAAAGAGSVGRSPAATAWTAVGVAVGRNGVGVGIVDGVGIGCRGGGVAGVGAGVGAGWRAAWGDATGEFDEVGVTDGTDAPVAGGAA